MKRYLGVIQSEAERLTKLVNDFLDVQRIEVIKGARSSLYGSDAIGGVINIITRAGAARGAGVAAAAGRYDARSFAADGGTEVGKLGVGASIAWTLCIHTSSQARR